MLQKYNKKNRYHILLRDNNPIGIDQPCIKIVNSELLFEKYRMALNQDKDTIDIQKDDAIKRDRIFFDFMLRMCNHINQLYEKEKSLMIYTILTYQSRNESAKENTSKPSPKKCCFVDETKKTSRAKSYSYKSNSNAKKGACSEASISEEEDVGMRKSRRKSDFKHTNKKSNGKSIEGEDIKLPKCGRKGNVENLNEETRESISAEEDIGILKCRRKSRIDKINEEVKGWTSSSNQQEYPPERTKTKEENHLEGTKRKLKQAALEWDGLDI